MKMQERMLLLLAMVMQDWFMGFLIKKAGCGGG